MPVASLQRARAMEGRLARELGGRGVCDADVQELIELHAAVMEPRYATFSDDHHPAWLHPARSALIVLGQMASPDPATLALALVIETEAEVGEDAQKEKEKEKEFRGAAAVALASMASRWASLALEESAAVVLPGHPTRLESLVVAPSWARTALLAERLDHLRHLHLWRGPTAVRSALAEVARVDLPAAERSDPGPARLLRGWLRRAERYCLAARARDQPRDGVEQPRDGV